MRRWGRDGSTNFTLAVVCAVLFLTFLDTTVVSVALSDIQSRLHAGVSALQWVVNGYALTFASLMLIAGSLSDRFGRRKVHARRAGHLRLRVPARGLGAQQRVLIGARVIMGVGAAASEPGTLSVIRHIYPDREERARALGAWAAVSSLALALGPVIGGALVGIGTWRAIFWFNVAASGVVMVLAAVTLPESADPEAARLDIPGFVVGAVGARRPCLCRDPRARRTGTGHSLVISLFVVGVVALVGFVRVERASRAPMLELGYFRSPPFSGALIVTFVAFFGIFSIFFFTALYLAAVIGYSPYRVAVGVRPHDRRHDRRRRPGRAAGGARLAEGPHGRGLRAGRGWDAAVGGAAQCPEAVYVADGDRWPWPASGSARPWCR